MKLFTQIIILAAGAVYFSVSFASDYTNDENRKVAALFLESSGRGYEKGDALDILKGRIEGRMKSAESKIAFSRLQACRTTEKYKNNPKDIVAVEHYAYMRRLAGEHGDSKLAGMPTLYYDTKLKLKTAGKLQWLRTTDQKVSDPTKGARDWGELGVVHGLLDYEAETTKKPAPGAIADELKSDLNLAVSHPIYSWLSRTITGNPFAKLKNSDCHVSEPDI